MRNQLTVLDKNLLACSAPQRFLNFQCHEEAGAVSYDHGNQDADVYVPAEAHFRFRELLSGTGHRHEPL